MFRGELPVIAIAVLLPVAFAQRQVAMLGMATPVHVIHGQQVKFSAYIKTVDIRGGGASLWWQKIDRGIQTLNLNRGCVVRGNTDWQLCEIPLPVFEEEADVRAGVSLSGEGSAWFNSFSLEIDGKPFADKHALDPGTWIRPRSYTNTGYDISIVRRWLRSSAEGPSAERDNAPTLLIRSTGTE